MINSYFAWFADLSTADVALAGGKGASLGEMTKAGIPVPPGFVVLTNAFDQFMVTTGIGEMIDQELAELSPQNLAEVEVVSEKLRTAILKAPFPLELQKTIQEAFTFLNSPCVAVRSSATAEDGVGASWAGELESFLYVDQSGLLQKVQECWTSLFTPRAICYRFEKGFLGKNVSVAVVVQKMVNAKVSGIAFSVHPVSQNPNHLIIEAGYGLGEAIVSGSVTPDSYVVAKSNLSIVDAYIAQQERRLIRADLGGSRWEHIPKSLQEVQKLSNDQILELAKIILTIEAHYGFPCDIEWALESDAFSIVQSRPITTLG